MRKIDIRITAGEDRRENDSEHQYQLAIVEVYVGDAHFYGDRSAKKLHVPTK